MISPDMRTRLIQLLLSALALALVSTARAQVPLDLTPGWNLLGNSSATSIDVASSFGDAGKITTVWKWNNTTSKWAFYAPSLSSAALAAYAQTKGHDVLISIGSKEGFWVNAASAGTLIGPVAAGAMLTEGDLQPGWNLMGSADSKSPSQLNQGLSGSLDAAGKALVTAWAWDAAKMQWKFFAPALEAQGGTALSDYIGSKGYLTFGAALSAAEGFWLNIGTAPPVQVAPDMSGVPVSMTADERNAALEKVAAFWTANKTGNRDADNDALASFIRAQSEFESAGVSPDQAVWARFKDGRPVVWHYPKRIADKATPVAPVKLTSAEQGEIPKGAKAVLFDFFRPGSGAAAEVATWLDTAGYTTEQASISLGQLMTRVQDAGILWIATHGLFALGQDGVVHYVLVSNDLYGGQSAAGSAENQLREQMYNEGLLVKAPMLDSDAKSNWGITDKFVSEFWTFTDDSLILIDSCSLFDARSDFADGTSGTRGFKLPASAAEAWANKLGFNLAAALAGVSFRSALTANSRGRTTIIGWNGLVDDIFAYYAVLRFFDRLLGANAFAAEQPPQRPFSYKAIYDWMVATGNAVDVKNSVGMKLFVRGTGEGQLVPSIGWASVYPGGTGGQYAGEWILDLAGSYFGPDPGTVTVNGTPLLVHSWTDTNIIAKLPDSLDSPGSSGDIVVEVRGHKSNAVPLTQWTGTVTQSMSGNEIGSGAQSVVSCPVRATGDVHYKRFAPGEAPMLASSLFIELTAKCTYTLSGTWSDDTAYYELSGSGTLEPGTAERTSGSLYCCAAGPATLPVDFTGVLTPSPITAGTLKTVDRTDGKAYYTPVNPSSWSYFPAIRPVPGVTLGIDYSFSATRGCTGPEGSYPTVCTETWNMTPVTNTVPTAATKS